jgi:NAD(P)-dependent dehydrogenase (short-subunit alcohol dehydrogenase family)
MKNLFDLTGKVALVTGGNSGIGYGMAEGLAQHGAKVVIWGTNAEKNAIAVEKISADGGHIQSATVDVTDEEAVKVAMAAIIAEHGRIDQAIANAGVSIPRASFFDIALDDFRRMNELNVLGVVSTLREAARHMVERHKAGDSGGSLVGISSTASIHGAARNEHYGATKGAVVSLCRAMAVELAPKGIRVNCIAPGWVRSEMTGKLQEWDKFNENVIGRVPFGGWADGADFAGIAVYLASKASRFHLGDTLVVDGGYTIY